MTKKKKIIITSAIGILLLGGVSTGAMLLHNKDAEPNTSTSVATELDAEEVTEITTEVVVEVTTEEKTTEEATTEEKADKEDKKKDDNKGKKEQAKESTTESVASANTGNTQVQSNDTKPHNTATKPQTSNTSGSTSQQPSNTSGNTSQQPSNTSSNTSQQSSTPPATKPESTQTTSQPTAEAPADPNQGKTKKVWVVDEPAWDETYEVYETKYRNVCHVCGAYMYSNDELIAHFDSGCNGGWYLESYQVCVGTETEHHEEVGHWEWQ